VIEASEWFQGIMTTALEEDELLAEVRLPLLPVGSRAGFYEFSRRAGDYALAMALVAWRDDGGTMREVRIGTFFGIGLLRKWMTCAFSAGLPTVAGGCRV
jgi:carbon-monoxide dehydrogenase medium subunit